MVRVKFPIIFPGPAWTLSLARRMHTGLNTQVHEVCTHSYYSLLHLIKHCIESGGSSPLSRKKASKTDVVISDPIPERLFVPSDDLQIHHVEPYNPLEPPSPDALTRRLAALTSGYGAKSPLLLDGSPITDSGTSSSDIGEVSHPQSSSPCVMQQRSDKPIIHPQRDSDDRAQDALRDSVRSLYQFWKLSSPDRLSDEAKKLFLSTVYQVVDQL